MRSTLFEHATEVAAGARFWIPGQLDRAVDSRNGWQVRVPAMPEGVRLSRRRAAWDLDSEFRVGCVFSNIVDNASGVCIILH